MCEVCCAGLNYATRRRRGCPASIDSSPQLGNVRRETEVLIKSTQRSGRRWLGVESSRRRRLLAEREGLVSPRGRARGVKRAYVYAGVLFYCVYVRGVQYSFIHSWTRATVHPALAGA